LKFDLKNVFDIPYIASESQRPLRVFLDQDYEQIIKGSHGLESFRILVLRSLIENEKVKMPSTIGLISSVQNEGKSFLCANLASTIAMMKKDVVIIDVDLRKSALSYHFFPNNNEGLSNLLDIKDFDSVIFRIADNFYLVPSGNKPIDPLAIFLSNRFKELLSYLKNQFDFIILDLPPIIGLSEATVITNQLDYLIFVIRYDSTKISEIKTALRSIKKDKVIAYVLNGVLPKRAYYEYYYAKKKHEIS
jgi:capsular exopolysaccharide synthesis family protein